MPPTPFDPNGAVRFDLHRGSAADSSGSRIVLVPDVAFANLDASALTEIGLALGQAAGRRVASRLGFEAGVCASPIEVVLSHLAGELAVAGVGVIHIERWGRAMVTVVSNPSIANDFFLAAVLGGALSTASGRDVAAQHLGEGGDPKRFFLGSQSAAARVRVLIDEGVGYAEVLASLQEGVS